MATRDEFWAEVDRLRVPRKYVSLEGGLPPDRFCLAKVDGQWAVYYSERGGREDETFHHSEEAALAELLARLVANARYLRTPPSAGGAPSLADFERCHAEDE